MATARLSRHLTIRDSRGFTLLELMVALTVAAILFGVGVPSFVDMVRNNRAAANVNELSAAFAIARSESARRGINVTVCRSTDGLACGADWAAGWIAFVDTAATDTAAPPVVGQVLRVWGAMSGNAAVTTRAAGAAADVAWVRFRPRGGVFTGTAMPLTLVIALAGCSGDQQRTLELNTVGRTNVRRTVCGT